MSLLPGQMLPQSQPIGRVNGDGTVTVDKNWFLLIYNLVQQVLSNGQGLPASALIELNATDSDANDSDAVVLRQPVSNLGAQIPDLLTAPAASDYPDIARALFWGQEPLLPDAPHQAPPSAPITPGASPYAYVAPASGTVVITGGTVSAIALIRQGTSIASGLTGGLIPVSRLDTVNVTYSAVPSMTFLAN